MREISLNELKQFLQKSEEIAHYAWQHYEELVAREKTYTLYGPYDYGIGAAIPGNFIPQRSRKLTKQTRRKHYVIYDLDNDFKLLRAIAVRDYTKVECIYHCFESDGVLYAYSFRGTEKKPFKEEVIAVCNVDQKPQYLAFLDTYRVFIQFFEHISPEKMMVTAYSYTPFSKLSGQGYPVDYSAPIGALNSPVERGYWEEVPAYTDFSQWFRKTEEGFQD